MTRKELIKTLSTCHSYVPNSYVLCALWLAVLALTCTLTTKLYADIYKLWTSSFTNIIIP